MLEIESKFEVAADAVLPALDGLPGVAAVGPPETEELEAVYLDTPDLDLAAVGISLRRRTGGQDDGWQLKLPARHGRLEIAEPLEQESGSAAVPERLRATVVVLTGDKTLGTVTTIRSHRTVRRLLDGHGRVLAVVADDRVSASDGRQATLQVWREWEVELVDGEPRVLEEVAQLLRGQGARASAWPSKLARALALQPSAGGSLPDLDRDSPATSVVQARLIEQVDRLRRLDPLLRVEAPDAVHDARVAIRRLRAALATYRPLLDRDLAQRLRGELKWLGGELSAARDVEVLHARLRAMLVAEVGESEAPDVLVHLQVQLREETQAARARLARALESPRYLDLVTELLGFAAAPAWTPMAERSVDEMLPARVAKDIKRLHKRVDEVAAASDVEERDQLLHQARKAVKRVRYAVEPLTGAYGKKARRIRKTAKRLQTILGEQHDSVVSRHWLGGLAQTATTDGRTNFLLGVLQTREEALSTRTQSEFATAWRKALDHDTLTDLD